MSQYNKTVLTNAGLALAKRANAGQAKFEITRAVTSADDWSNKTVQDLEEVTTIPDIMQQGTVMDAEEVESNNSVIGVSLCFTNKDLSTSYQIRVIGLYVKEEGQDKDFLYAVTTAVSPEYMPDFNDKVMYRFNMQMYLVIGKAQAVNVVINDGASVTHGQFDKYKSEVTADLEKIENAHKEDMSHVVKSASVNGGAEILPDGSGKLNLIVPDPDLSKYVSLEQLGELLKAKADITAVPDKTDTEEGIKQAKAAAKAADDKAQSALVQLPNKADTSTVNAQIADAKNTIKSTVDNLQSAINTKANASDVYTKKLVDDAFSNRDNSISNLINRVKQIDGETVIGNAVDVNTLEGTPNQVTVYKLSNASNTNTPSWISDHRGVMIVLNYDGNAKTQIWTPVGYGAFNKDGSFGWRYWEGENPTDWNRLASVSYVDNLHNDLQNQINANDKGTITTGYDWNTGTPTNESRALQNAWLVDQIALKGAVDRMNSINSNANGRLSLDGGNMNLRSMINWTGGDIDAKTGNLGGLHWSGGTDTASIYGDQNNNDNLDLAFDLGDDSSNHFSFRNNGSEVAAIDSNGHYTGTVDWNNVSGHPDVDAISNKVNVDGILFRKITHSNTWQDIFGVPNNNKKVLTLLRIDPGGSGALLNEWASGIGFGGSDTKSVLSVNTFEHQARITSGNGNTPIWSEDIAWQSDIDRLQNIINQQNQTIQSLITRLNNAENEIRYIKDNYIEGKRFQASQEAQAEAWENEKPTRLAMIEK
ncbi:hypothetical protein IMAU20067_01447 [Lactobacillus helveticus]|uniref:hypothetical protein n=1 Tax=Lactobacillus helveticus TaxID=1587 RepID=UPI0015622702|nr:hypothetical protein [Lactobacillus helveticus]NRO74598.1 hypothetical protein [Lactobacillus helveticus]